MSLLALAITFVILILLILQITPAINRFRSEGIIKQAIAEGSEKIDVSARGFEGVSVLTGRTELWSRTIDYIKHHKVLLLTGESKISPLGGFDNYFGHCHSIYLQVLLESGVVGLLLLVLFIIYLISNAFWVVLMREMPPWVCLLPAIPISLWVGDLAECFTWLRSSHCPMAAVLFISAGILSAAVTEKYNGQPVFE